MPIPAPGPEARVYQPAELNQEVRLHLEAGFPRLWLAGEISNLARPGSGHLYFSLKDARAQIRCALFRGQLGNVEGHPENGDQVLVRGRLSLYEPRGDYQLIADAILPAGSGALQQAFEALKKKLEAEGLFDASRKRALPGYPTRIAVVTSPTGAAIRDILTTLRRRWPAARVELHPAQVQGAEAVPALLRALDQAAQANAEVLILARGGGSIEDLWAFNDEALARRIATMPMPVVSGVGHETDFTIADFVADLRAATPTAAAEAATPDGPALRRKIDELQSRLGRARQRLLEQLWQRLDRAQRRLATQHPQRRLDEGQARLNTLQRRLRRAVELRLNTLAERYRALSQRAVARSPARHLQESGQRLGSLQRRLARAVDLELQRHAQRLAAAARALNAVSPLAVLGRGYALVEDEDGRLLSRPEDFITGRDIHTRIRNFRVQSRVLRVEIPDERGDQKGEDRGDP
ncbi:MAG: exodeoxyribonuclease VII large subunit [Gammaproteobacteria bacterium HGW-Gammaproteobacteria-8]|nr:MAG: exodeoxyribonuclease VII large subunit [Gammaproteobacteria bacterium HGW-Gammaproteobacteria-8]